MFKILTLNNIAAAGINQMPREQYEITSESQCPDAVLVRSFKMNNWNISQSNGKDLIINSITFLFYINNEDTLPIQYICMNLNFFK